MQGFEERSSHKHSSSDLAMHSSEHVSHATLSLPSDGANLLARPEAVRRVKVENVDRPVD